ncbi:GSCFA domain-containing protein [Galbibacter mesophilus]|uniref:GSCFA domain-containing protein n=1 Tax=Galbibacter mesophilus TaxID=379069 RepID=UPI00191CB18D|nr:GSCFA domain-containing protein [Galbibacter mesophilus]MCM5664225.1 GSCFA domain-containing protein [Galbibacter mesophilus]
MKLQTEIQLKPQQNRIDYHSKVFLMGSCFVENMGEKLDYYKFQAEVNPFGIIFHPKAIEALLKRVVHQNEFTEEDIFLLNERWHCFEVHSCLSNPSKEDLLKTLNTILAETYTFLQQASHVAFTLGTAWGYQLKETQQWVANCHKVPQKNFDKSILEVAELEETLTQIVSLVKQLNPTAGLIFTVSPVRHIKDGMVENQRSKAHLLTSVHQIIDEKQNTFYFPSYELMMDELRDYRFYAEDMLHPNATAINYIWEKFSSVWFAPSTENIMKEIEKIQSGLAHRPFNPSSAEYKKFQENLQQKITYLSEKHPHINF